MLEIAITLIVGFALGYGVREWAFRRDHSQQRRRRPFWGEARSGGRLAQISSGMAGECTAKEIWPSGQLKGFAVLW